MNESTNFMAFEEWVGKLIQSVKEANFYIITPVADRSERYRNLAKKERKNVRTS